MNIHSCKVSAKTNAQMREQMGDCCNKGLSRGSCLLVCCLCVLCLVFVLFFLSDHILYLSVRDPLVDGLGSSNENGVSVVAAQGSTRISAAQYGALAREYAPDIVASISDEVASTVASNRARKASQRSVMWADEMLSALNLQSKDAPARRPLFFASIQGGADLEQRATSCSEYTRRAAQSDAATAAGRSPLCSIDGFVIGGLGSGEDAAKRAEIIEAVVAALPASKPRVLSSSSGLHGQPEEVLAGVARGIDLFEVEYPHQLTLLGQASVMWIGDADDTVAASAAASASNLPESSDRPQTKLHLRDSRYAHDQSPILRGCQCFTCKNHTRAYLHHLLNVHEMTAPILIDLSVPARTHKTLSRTALLLLLSSALPPPFSACKSWT